MGRPCPTRNSCAPITYRARALRPFRLALDRLAQLGLLESYGRSEAVFLEINDALYGLTEVPRPRGSLGGSNGSYLRVGDYLIVYRIDDERRVLTIADILRRGGLA